MNLYLQYIFTTNTVAAATATAAHFPPQLHLQSSQERNIICGESIDQN